MLGAVPVSILTRHRPCKGTPKLVITMSHPISPSVDPAELKKFAAMASAWWDPHGSFKPLHQLAPVRLEFIRDEVGDHFKLADKTAAKNVAKPFKDLKILDVGCGGGLLSEPMVRLGGTVLGLDAEAANIEAARVHADGMGLTIDYRVGTAEELAAEGMTFDLILNMEVVEHVADMPLFLAACASLLTPDGLMIISTINRTAKAFGLAVVGAEYVLRWLPRGTHNWRKFIKPSELARAMRPHGLQLGKLTGVVYRPINGTWGLGPDLSVNYMTAFSRT